MKDYSQSTSRMTSISEKEMNIQIRLFDVRHLNGILRDFSGSLSEKEALTEKKKIKILGKQLLFLKNVMLLSQEKFMTLYRQ